MDIQMVKSQKTYGIHSGFTLIELVIVIVLLGILAATALPKFANLTTQATTAANRGVGGALGSAVSIAHAQWLASGSPATITLEGNIFHIGTNGYPDGAGATAATDAASCGTLVYSATNTGLLTNPPPMQVSCAGTSGLCYQSTFGAGPICTYTAYNGGTVISPATSIVYNSTTGAIVITP